MRTAARIIFAVAVAVAVVSFTAMILGARWDAALRFGIVALLIAGTRVARVPPSFSAAFAILILIATWAGVAHWYRQVSILDAVIHFFTPGSVAAVAYFVLAAARVFPDLRRGTVSLRRSAPVFWVWAVGTTAAVVWEFYEWAMEQWLPGAVRVGYTDTVVDLFAGTLVSLTAGALVVQWARTRTGAAAPTGAR